MNKIPMRQTHLDFHTSPDIENIGANFSEEDFQAALKEGNLDSITVFAKCHHSMCYYPTKIGTMHPHLNFDLTGAMVDAAHKIGVRAPIYITVGWSDKDAKDHPEWQLRQKDGSPLIMSDMGEVTDENAPKPHCNWHMLCFCDGGEYAEHIYALTREVCERYEKVDGIFYDICSIGNACYCDSCKKSMIEMGLDPDNDEDANKHLIMKRQAFMEKCQNLIKSLHPDASVFFNGCASQYKPYYQDWNTHFELEDLPTAWGGYDKLPMRAKYFVKKGKGVIGMTGKFHLSWGEFGGFKSADALKYEISLMALYGAGASIGDHMHPDGEMEMQTYKNIGYAYRYLESIAPFCYNGKAIANVGILPCSTSAENEGISNILLENQIDYDLVTNGDFDKFDTVIIPGYVPMSDEETQALKNYIANGGKIILMADALVENGKFIIDMGFEYIGRAEYDCDYLVPKFEAENLPDAPMLCNFPGHRVACNGGEITAEFITPYFSRTYKHFCGHKNTPNDKNSKPYPAIVKKDNIVYISHMLGKEYLEYGSLYHKRYFMKALNLIYSGSILEVEGLGAQGRCTMIEQKDKNRYCINLTYASPVRRGKAEIIEDIMPIYNIKITINTDKNIKHIYEGLSGKELEFTAKDGKTEFILPKLQCHCSIVAEY